MRLEQRASEARTATPLRRQQPGVQRGPVVVGPLEADGRVETGRAARPRQLIILPIEELMQGEDQRLRRALNVAVATLALIVLLPLMLLVAVLVRLSGEGPVIYKQPRIGMDRRRYFISDNHRRHVDVGGEPFTMYKFRTMRPSAYEAQVWASPEDPRVTPVGRVLRKLRLDELPQLWNVLRGDMNIVGPRPEQPEIFQQLRQCIPHYARRQRVLPGITGLAQIHLSYDRQLEDVRRKLELDLEYIARQSVREDLRIMLRTLPVLLLAKGSW